MKLKCSQLKINCDLEDNMTICLSVDKSCVRDAKEGYDSLKDRELTCELKKYRPARSLDANAYLWVLCSKIAEKLGITKEEVYRREIKEVGVYDVVEVTHIAYQRLCVRWSEHGTGWFCECLDETRDGKLTVAAYYGSSTYDTLEMKRLIDNVIEEAKAQGIQTETPSEIALMMARWNDQCFKREKNV